MSGEGTKKQREQQSDRDRQQGQKGGHNQGQDDRDRKGGQNQGQGDRDQKSGQGKHQRDVSALDETQD